MKLYQAVTSPFAVRVRIALYAKGVEAEFVSPPDGMGSEAFRKITPLGKVPTLVCDDGAVIAESAVINEYLEETCPDPALLPAAPKARARVRMVVQMTDAYVFARYLPLFATAKAEGREAPAVADGIEGVKEGLGAVERSSMTRPMRWGMICLSATAGWPRRSSTLQNMQRNILPPAISWGTARSLKITGRASKPIRTSPGRSPTDRHLVLLQSKSRAGGITCDDAFASIAKR